MAEIDSIPVVLHGLGVVGQAVARAALEKPELRIVGAVDRAQAGRTLRELLGPGAPPVEIAADPARPFAAARGGVVLHASGSRFADALPEIDRAVEAGLAVVSTCEELACPWIHDEEASERLDARCEQHGVAVVALGALAGFGLDRLPATLSHAVGSVRHVRATRVVDVAAGSDALRRVAGVGLDEAAFDAAWDRGEIGRAGLAQAAQLLARGCGLELDDLEEELEPLVAEEDGPGIAVGRVAGVAQVVRGFLDGAERVRLELQLSMHADEPRDEVELDAASPIHAVLKGGLHGDLAAAWEVVNAVPAITGLQGLLTVLDLPAGR